ncbi:MAG: SGNH hydrolase domain-containing protein, partial [Glycocaulis sp.]
ACTQWNAALLDQLLAEPPDLVITTMSPRYPMLNARNEAARRAAYADGLTRVWDRLAQAGVPVAVIRPTPGFPSDVLECYAANTGAPERCGAAREDVLPVDDVVSAAVPLASRAYLLDLNDGVCGPERCEPVVGNVIVYRDRHHLTASYVRTLTDELERQLRAIDAQDMARFGRDNPLFAPALLQ